MAGQEFTDDFERLENRMRTNFFDIEKRLSDMESRIQPQGIEEPIERIQELEDLQMLMQAEMLQVKQQVMGDTSEINTGDLNKRIARIEEAVSKGISVSVSDDIAKRVDNLEKVKDTGNMINLLQDMERKIDEKLMRAGNSNPEHHERRLFDLEKKINEAGKSGSQIDTRKLSSIEEQLSRNMERVEEFEKIIRQSNEHAMKRMNELENLIENSGKPLTEPGMKSFLNKIMEEKNEIMKKMENFDSARERMDKLLNERQRLIQRLDDSEVVISKAEAILSKIKTESSKMENYADKISTSEERIQNLIEDKLGAAETLRAELFERSDKMSQKAEAEMQKYSALREEMAVMLDMAKKRLAELEKIDSSFEKAVEDAMAPRISAIADEVEARVSSKEDINGNSRINSMENQLNDLSSEVGRLESMIGKSPVNDDRLYEETNRMMNEHMKKFSSYVDEKVVKNLKNELRKEISTKQPGSGYGNELILNKISSMESQISAIQRMLRSHPMNSAVILE